MHIGMRFAKRRAPLTEWILDREHPGKAVARLVALVFAILPFIAFLAMAIDKTRLGAWLLP
jgi:hypothetical protein